MKGTITHYVIASNTALSHLGEIRPLFMFAQCLHIISQRYLSLYKIANVYVKELRVNCTCEIENFSVDNVR